ncbi:Phospholipid hydroperoxide glutathione peroxidase [Heracleum sosnowskyi]|uniref:Phospholipid hydroperoxide glutathione peroxidase n=1 Tax=Heracleum sosnowskyi TaxID=360622 RepID=A0AAD8MK14_9APIA|nr:Phospholipid hydroperoxide glutathione peroxidase [Heracleum sosnowskyi]
MKFLKKIAGLLGFAKDESNELKDEQVNDGQRVDLDENQTRNLPRKGFSVPVQVPVDRAQPGPVLLPTSGRDGGVQGFKWYARRLRIDEEGDVADEFLDEVLPEVKTVSMTEGNKHRSLPTFEVKYSTLPAKVRSQVLTQGRIQHSVEHQGRLLWV